MIDCENEIFDIIAKRLREAFPGITVKGEQELIPSKFPCAYIEEADNYSLQRTRDSGSNENHATVMYEVNVYSNKTSGKKSECKKIFNEIDEAFSSLNFTRIMKQPLPTDDATKSRIVGRYEANISKDKTIYRR